MQKSVIIVAGGLGTRMGSDIPKQFIVVHEKTVLEHTIDAFLDFDARIKIVLVIHPDYIGAWDAIKNARAKYAGIRETKGGKTRFESVQNGLKILHDEDGIIGVHDAARPLISNELLSRCYHSAEKSGNAIPSVPSLESLRILTTDGNSILDRSNVVRIQTPQCFRIKDLKLAYEVDYKESFTDDASVVENLGQKIHLIRGESDNIKITTPKDLDYFRFILDQRDR